MFNLFGKRPSDDAPPSEDESLNLDASSSTELRRVTVNPSAGLPQDSAIIPDIEAWLQGRSKTDQREILKNSFDDTEFRS
ncbi:MAG: hypothetical protein KDA75_15240 [Planctomycetaceae bacterium]|nr:hypothetical protein [Planctomycetaceae bacterium]